MPADKKKSDHLQESRQCWLQGELFEPPQSLYIPPESFYVFLSLFNGPFELLLYLVRKQRLTIAQVDLLKVIHQYLAYIDWLQQDSKRLVAEHLIGDYLLMASFLIGLKLRMLLPSTDEEPDDFEMDLEAAQLLLIERLSDYARFQSLSRWLIQRAQAQTKSIRVLRPFFSPLPTEALTHNITDLLEVHCNLARRVHNPSAPLPFARTTSKQRMENYQALHFDQLQSANPFGFPFVHWICHQGTRMDQVMSFLSLLDLANQGRLHLNMDSEIGLMILNPDDKEAIHAAID